MTKKILGICAALVALGALAIGPATAMAATHLTDTSEGVTTTVAANSWIKAISTGTAEFGAGSFNVKCNENFLTGTVHRNSGGVVEGTITHGAFDSNLTASPTDCSSNLGPTRVTLPQLENTITTEHWCIKNGEGDIFNVFGRNCTAEGEGTLTFILDVTGVTSCPYAREGAVRGEFTTPENHETSTLSVTGEPEFKREGTNILCPASGKITKMVFDLYTDTSGTATSEWDDAASTADPIWLAA